MPVDEPAIGTQRKSGVTWKAPAKTYSSNVTLVTTWKWRQ